MVSTILELTRPYVIILVTLLSVLNSQSKFYKVYMTPNGYRLAAREFVEFTKNPSRSIIPKVVFFRRNTYNITVPHS